MRTLRLVALAQLAVVGMACATAATAGAEPAPRKIAFIVPGQQLYGSGQAWELVYSQLRASLEQRGFETHYIDAPGKLLRDDAELIRTTVTSIATTDDDVAIVAHSVGGLSARYYLKELGGTDLVDAFVGVGTATYGSPAGCAQGPAAGYDSCPQSSLFPELNAGDDTPGATRYAVVQTSGEWADGRLDGGQCRSYVDGVPGWGTGLDHLAEIADPRVLSEIGDAAEGGCPGTYVDDPDNSFGWRDTMTPTAPPIP